jgi:predicted PurR-regulated permease PerM
MEAMDPAERKDTAQHALVYVGVAVAVVVILVLAWYAIDVVLLAFIGVLAAILLRAPADWLSARFGLSERWSLVLVGSVLLVLLAVGGVLFGLGIASQALALIDRIPEIVASFKDELGQTELGARVVALAESSGLFAGGEGVQFLGRGLGLIGSTFGAVANVLIVLFFAVFMAAQPRPYVDGLLFLVPRKRRERMREVFDEIGHVLRRWLLGQSFVAVCVAVLTGVGLLLLGAPFPFALALLAGLMEFVPYIGPFVAAIPAILVAFAEGPQLALYVGLLFVGIQLTESYLLAPLVQQRAVYLPPAVILFAQVVMGVMVGALGVAVATPLAAAIMVAVSMLYVEDALGDKNASPAASPAPSRGRSSPSGGTTRRSPRSSP